VLDYGHEIVFGYFLLPDASDPEGVVETGVLADRLGYDLLGVHDHPYQRGHLDTPSLLGFILARTQRIRVFQAVGISRCARRPCSRRRPRCSTS
jgi:alkanesulfonate monooxygenase SsuD/methylene tetrahydromethanopterin reductase-like flavin-dependent oxidoreductase (luciferase family)